MSLFIHVRLCLESCIATKLSWWKCSSWYSHSFIPSLLTTSLHFITHFCEVEFPSLEYISGHIDIWILILSNSWPGIPWRCIVAFLVFTWINWLWSSHEVILQIHKVFVGKSIVSIWIHELEHFDQCCFVKPDVELIKHEHKLVETDASSLFDVKLSESVRCLPKLLVECFLKMSQPILHLWISTDIGWINNRRSWFTLNEAECVILLAFLIESIFILLTNNFEKFSLINFGASFDDSIMLIKRNKCV